jgi:Transglycosylase SLT domain
MADDNSDIQQAIIGAANDYGVDPSWALSVAERESDFDPNARASKTIKGLFQMTKGLRDQYGIGDSNDPGTQAAGFMKYSQDLKGEMSRVLGRDPTPQELYAGHHFGGVRAARMIAGGQGDTPVQDVFTAQEMAGNPHFARAGTTGNLLASLDSDISRRMQKFGGGAVPGMTARSASSAPSTASAAPQDYSSFGPSIAGLMSEDTTQAPAKVKKESQPEKDDLEPDQLAPLKTAMQPIIPQSGGGGLPSLPSIAAPQTGLSPKDILTGKPGLTGALAPMMGNPNA